jgi:hypothetical protein
MHKQGVTKMFDGENTSLKQFWKCQWLKDNDLKWIATQWFQENFMSFSKEHIIAYLDNSFVSKQGIGLQKYKQIMESKCLAKLDSSPQYIELQNSKRFSK